MSNVKISGLPPGPALTGSELLETSNALVSQSVTAAQIVTLGDTWTANQIGNGFALENAVFADDVDNTKLLDLDLSGNTNNITLTLATAQSTNQTLNVPNITAGDTLVTEAFAQILTNKTIDAANNTLSNIDETMQIVSVGAAGTVLTSNGVAVAPTYQALPASGITSLNGDSAAVQTLTGGTGIDIIDSTPDHSFAIDATVATLADAQTLTNKTITAAANTLTIASTDLTDTADLVRNNQANTYSAFLQQFTPSLAGNAGLNVGAIGGSPTTQIDGDIWYDSNTNTLFGRINGVDVDLGQQSTEIFTWTANHNANGNALVDPLFADPTDTTKRLDIDLAGNATTVVLTLDINQSSSQSLTVPDIIGADTIVTNDIAAVLLSKTLSTGTAFNAVPTIANGIRFTFNPDNTESGVNVGENATDPTNAINGDIYYQTGVGFRIRDQATWVTLNQPDTPWTVLHDAARFNLDNTGAIIFSLSGPTAAPLVTDPYIAYDTSLAPDALVYNTPTNIEHRFHINGIEEYTFTPNAFNGNGNTIQNFTAIQLSAVTPGPIIQLTNSSSSPAAGTTIGEIRFIGDTVGGGNVDYAIDRTVVRDNSAASPDGERQLLCEAAGTLVEFMALNHNALGITFFAREISFTNGQGIVDPQFTREILTFMSVGTSAINEIQITNAITATGPIIETTGGDANIDLNIRQKGDANIIFSDEDGLEELLVLNQTPGAAVNHVEITNSLTNVNPIIAAEGGNTNIGLEIRMKGEDFMLFTNDGNEEMLQLTQVVGAATNYIEITNALTATAPIIAAVGSDADISLIINAKGTGSVIVDSSPFSFGSTTELTIATGAITVTKSFHRVDTEADAATDDLDTINSAGSQEGDVLVIHAEDSARTVSVTEAGNIKLSAAPFALDNVEDTLTLIFNGTDWLEVSRSDNGA